MLRRSYRFAIALGLAGCGSFAAAAPDEPPAGVDPEGADLADAEAGADVQPPTDGAPSDAADAGAADATTDASPILDGSAWSSPNGATWTVKPDGTQITAQGGYNHPVLVWVASSMTSAEDYTVTATIKSPPSPGLTREFGLFARAGAGGAGVVLGSEYGGSTKPFLAPMGPPDWNPVSSTFGAAYTAKASTSYKMKLQVIGTMVSGKLWEATAAEPGLFQVIGTSASPTGKLAGFYTYGVNGAVLEAFSISVP